MRMNRLCFVALIIVFPLLAGAQELYVFSEPASNMPARSMSLKLTGRYPDSKKNNYFKQRYNPEVMFGLSKKWMLHIAGSLSDYYSPKIRPESIKAYAKYRFLSNDEVHRHFRMAAFTEFAYSRNDFLYDEFSLDGDLSGMQLGLIATQLVNKFAASVTANYTQGFGEIPPHHKIGGDPRQMFNYSLSGGYLLFPKNYTSYRQTNLNLYLELLGAKSINRGDYYTDLAPAVQLIFNSTTKLNLGARFQLSGNMVRVGERTYLVSMEHTILNVLKKK